MSPTVTVCPVSGCGRITNHGLCADHAYARRQVRRRRDIERIYESGRWRRETRPAVLERDGYRCTVCGVTQDVARLDVAHIYPTQQLLAAGADVYDPDLCRTLCASCHGRERTV